MSGTRSDCRRAGRALELRFGAELGLEESLWLDEHLAACPACARIDARARVLEDGLAALRVPALERVDPHAAAARVRAAIAAGRAAAGAAREEGEVPAPVRPRLLRRVLVAASAAALVVVLSWPWGDPAPQGPAIEELVHTDGPTPPPVTPRSAPSVPERLARAEAPIDPPLAQRDTAPADGQGAPGSTAAASPLPVVPVPAADAEHALRSARTRLAALLAAPSTERSSADPRLADLRAEGWPVERMLEQCAREEDEAPAAAALDLLTQLAGAGERGALASLDRLARDSRRGLAALERLARLDGIAAPALMREAHRSGATPLVLAWLERRPPAEARAHALGLLDGGAAGELAAALVDLVLETDPDGSDGLEALLEPRRLRRLGTELVAGALAGRAAVGEVLERRLSARPTGEEARGALLDLCGRLTPPEALPVLALLAQERGSRGAALEALARYRGPAPVAILLGLHEQGWLPLGDLERELARRLELDPQGLAAAAAAWARVHPRRGSGVGEEELEPWLAGWRGLAVGDPWQLELLLEAAVLSDRPAAVPTVLALVECGLLDEDDRERALLAAGELAGPEHLAAFGALFRASLELDVQEAADCLWIVHRLAGEEGVRELWTSVLPPVSLPADGANGKGRGELPPRLLEPLRRATGPAGAVARFRLARELAAARSLLEPNRTP